jgi:two-component system invasion response regulator UvrY
MKILLVDDHETIRRGLMHILIEVLDEVTFGEAATGTEALDCIERENWDLIVLDLNMPGRNGLDVLATLQVRCCMPRVLVFSVAPEKEYALRVLRRGAAGYLNKNATAAEIGTAVRRVAAGGRYISPVLAEQLAAGLAAPEQVNHPATLSDRELQVLEMIANGMSIKTIAGELCLSEKTVFTYRERLRLKLDVKSDVDLARYALRYHLVD